MARIKPASTVTFYKDVPIAGGYQIAFPSRKKQKEYFDRHIAFKNVKCSYVRRNGTFKAHLTTDQAKQVNYMSFINPDFEGILWYAVVTDYAYLNNSTTIISFELDPWQTFWDQVKFSPSKIIRQHTSILHDVEATSDPWRNDIIELSTTEGGDFQELAYRVPEVRYDYPIIPSDRAGNTICVVQVTGVRDANDQQFDAIKNLSEEIIYPDGSSMTGTRYRNLPPRDTTMIFVRHGRGTGETGKLPDVLKTLTLLGLKDNIHSIYNIHRDIVTRFRAFASGNVPSPWFTVSGIKGRWKNAKLCRFPFQWLRVSNRDSGIKEYKFEKSERLELPEQEKGINFCYIPYLFETPRAFLVPYGYRSRQTNFSERMEFRNFQAVPYSIDSYYLYLATEHQKMLMEQTNGTLQGTATLMSAKGMTSNNRAVAAISATAGYIGVAGGAALDVVSSINYTPAVPGELNPNLSNRVNYGTADNPSFGYDVSEPVYTPGTGTPSSLSVNPGRIARATVSGVNSIARHTELSRAIGIRYGKLPESSIYSGGKDLFIANEYVEPPAGANILEYLQQTVPDVDGTIPHVLEPGQFTFEIMQVRDEILDIWEDYFDRYGYLWGVTSIPLIVTYCNGSVDPEKVPVFRDIDGYRQTYVLVEDMQVEHAQKWISDAIATMFNSGIRFLEGEALE